MSTRKKSERSGVAEVGTSLNPMFALAGQIAGMLYKCDGMHRKASSEAQWDRVGRELSKIHHPLKLLSNMMDLRYEHLMQQEYDSRLWWSSTEELSEQRRKIDAVIKSRSPKNVGRPGGYGIPDLITQVAHWELEGWRPYQIVVNKLGLPHKTPEHKAMIQKLSYYSDKIAAKKEEIRAQQGSVAMSA